MTVRLNHTIVHARDKRAAADFYSSFEDPGGNLLEIITRPYGSRQ